MGTDGNQNIFAVQIARRAIPIDNFYRMGIFKFGEALNQFDFVRRKIRGNFCALRRHHRVLAMHEPLHRQPFAQRVVDAVKPALPKPRKIKRRLAQNLARQRPGVDARPAEITNAIAGAALGVRADALDILDAREVRFHCPCTRERASITLGLLGQDDLAAMIREDGAAEVTCDFCRTVYQFTDAELEQIRRALRDESVAPS